MQQSLTAQGFTHEILLRPGESATYAVVGTFTGYASLRFATKGDNWIIVTRGAVDTGISGTFVNETGHNLRLRLCAEDTAAGTPFTGTLVCTLLPVSTSAAAADIATVEHVRTNGSTATTANLAVYQTSVTSSGSAGAETLNVGDGTGAVIGQRKLVTLATRTNAADSVALDDTHCAQGADTITAVVLDAAGEFVLLEWRGTKWEVIKASAGVVATA
jgi:hypothetical protein